MNTEQAHRPIGTGRGIRVRPDLIVHFRAVGDPLEHVFEVVGPDGRVYGQVWRSYSG